MRDDAVLAVTAAHRLGALRSDRWPLAAAHLLAEGVDHQGVVALASLSAGASGWEVDQLVPGVLEEVDAPALGVEPAGLVFARVLALTTMTDVDFALVRRLAELAPSLGHPGGVIGEAYAAVEWLDCACHLVSEEREGAVKLEARLQLAPRLDISAALAAALSP